MTEDKLIPALERAGKLSAALNPADLINEKSGCSGADLQAIVVAAEPMTTEDRLDEKLGDVA